MAIIIDGKEVAKAKREQIKSRVEELKSQGKTVGLAVIIVGENPASRVYVNNKKKGCLEVGIESFEYALPESTTEEELKEVFKNLRHFIISHHRNMAYYLILALSSLCQK